ncbi:TOMM precursor leader peptide-binding protein [Streptantibioticus silvisoli]|uniref:TOMM leader peptide-binding protein n=1 Tax=Streptantibioticus silvisoli TaxID=2705255 RepID=A0ABT6VWW8_9ACTN|nr:TOMM precursor leader peptide-binding protein [Streptantibioticus silvisoli]MDI5961761.1 TOMM precursor leader peptide-binding protein [Streptantibioticus silvisoli]
MTTTLAPAPDPAPAVLAAVDDACRWLAGRLAAGAAGGVPPAVVPLGAHDALLTGRDPYAAERPGARVHLARDGVLIGPWGDAPAAERACGQCLAMRWQRLRTRSEREALETGGASTATGRWPVLPDFVADAVAALAGRAAADRGAADLPRVTRLDLATLQVVTYPLLREPLCPSCAADGLDTWPPQSPWPVERVKAAPEAYRLCAPADYRLPHAALANPVCGVLGAATWTDITSPTTAPVAGSVFMRGYAGLTDVTWSGQANAFAASRDLAFLEGMERYAGTHRRDRAPLRVASYEELGDLALDPRDAGLYAPETYRDDPMVRPFDPARPIPWIPGHSLRDDRTVLVPARLVHYSAGVAADDFVFECSNGCAIGSCLEEAALFGLLELIERDAFLLAWYGRARLTEIDLESVGGRRVRAMADRAALRGYDVRAFDNRVDLAVPVVTALAVRRDGGPGTLAFAAGAAFDPEAAVESALSEILTYIPHLPGQVRERPAELEAMADDYDLVKRLPDHAALFGLPRMAEHAREFLDPGPVRSLPELYAGWQERRPRTADLRDDLAVVREELTGAGFDVIVVDQTTPEQRRLGLRTVATLVPGLLPIDFGWNRQRALTMPRLRTALRRAGLRATDLAEQEVRRVPHPFP